MRQLVLAAVGAALLVAGCTEQPPSRNRPWEPAKSGDAASSSRPAARPEPATYQAEVEEGIGAAIAVVIDTSGSMSAAAAGDRSPKHVVAKQAVQKMLEATEAFIARRPDFPIKIAIFHFSSDAWRLLPIQPYDRNRIDRALASVPAPGGGTAIGEAMAAARPELYRAGTYRKYILVVTDGENTAGRAPADVAREIHRKSEGAVQIYFVAFDVSPEKFGFLGEIGGEVVGAHNEAELTKALDGIYHGKILAEALDAGETEVGPQPPGRESR